MKINLRLLAILICASLAPIAVAQEEIQDVFDDPAIDFNRPADRARAVERIRAIEQANLERARVKAQAMGIPMRRELPNGGATEIMGLDENGEFIIHTTHNVNAAISTAANLVQSSPYSLNGSGITVGVWDGGAVRTTHQEFATGSRVTVKDGASTLSDHATHVAGTIAAAGVSANAKGMATQARVDSYEWTSDTSEMLGRGATAPGQADKIYVSNHSYGYVEGWDGNTWRGTGTDQNAYDPQFGQYSSAARSWDDTVFKSPYYLPFKSAGNDNSNNPATGSSVVIGGSTVTYDPAIHPKGDGLYRNSTTSSANGYENIGSNGTAKNIMTVGAANDAVTSGQRDPSKSTLTGFSSRGPTDDGRIKPDIVANGAGLYSPVSGSNNTSYGNYSGTSMSSPNAAGSASLLVQLYANLFNGGAMRASTLKGLIIHTATDIGNPGPDYHYGWGLMNTKEAADLIIDHQTYPSKQRIIEDQVTSSVTTKTYSFLWDGSSALRTTMCWTDPPGTSTTSHDLRTPRLVNNLNLKLIAPNGNEYFPYVMPFVGTWTVASMSQNATTGINNTDNVEQVRIATPGQTGTWQAVVSYTGTLTNNLQNFSLLFSGVSDGIIPLTLNSITPNSGTVGSTVTADITGTALSTDTSIRLRQPGRADIIGTSAQMINATTLRCQFNLTGAASGSWNLVATNPDGETFTLPDAFAISGTLTTIPVENFDAFANGALSNGWTSTTSPGTNSWTVVSSPEHPSHTPTKSCYVTGPANSSVTYLTSPSIAIPSGAANLQLQFWHQYDINTRHGGRFSMSIDNGPWFDVTDTGSGAAFTGNGYNSTVVGTGQTSAFANLSAWTGASNGFIRTTVSLNDIPKYAGKNVRLRWGIATNSNQTSAHWYVDSIAITSDSSTPNQPPVITSAASTDSIETVVDGPTTYQILRGTGTDLSVTASDDAGEADLTYTWQATGPAAVSYSLNGNNAAKNTTATFTAAGDYAVTVTALDTGGLTTTSTVNVRILNTSTFVVAPESAILGNGGTQQFTATLINQFGTPDAIQPSPVTWSTSGGGTISTGGLFTATTVGGPYLITATAGTYTDTAEVTVNPAQAGIELQNLNRTYNGSPQVVTAVTSPPGLDYSVTYNGQSTAPANAGSYDVAATITDPNYQGTASGTLVIAKAAQTITFDPLAPVGNDQEDFALTATSSSGLPVSYTSSNPAVATISGNIVNVIAAGTTTITASQPGDANYEPAANVQRTLEVQLTQPQANPGGPYRFFVGQTLALSGSASLASFGETISAYDWDLNNDGTFGDVTGATPSISYSDATSIWDINPGLNTIQLRVTDSANKTSTASTTVELVIALQWDANGTTAGQTNGGGAWLGGNLWWDGVTNLAWISGSDATFGGPSTNGGSVTLASPTTANALVFNTFTGTYTLGTAGNTITLKGGITKNTGSGAVSIISPVTLGGNQTWSNPTGTLTTGNGTNLIDNAGFQLTVSGAGTTTFGVINNTAAAITGSGALVKNGSGTLSLGGANAGFTGNVTVNGGILRVNSSASINGNLNLADGVYEHYWNDPYTRTLGTGAGQIQITGGTSGFSENGNTGMTVTINNNASFELVWGTALFNPSTFVLQADSAQQSSSLTLANKIDFNGTTRTIHVSGGTTGAARAAISGQIRNSSGTAGLVKTGAGMLNITSASSAWNGPTTIQGGVLDLGGMTNASIGGGTGRSITLATGTGVRFNALSNTFLNRIVETSAEITVMTGSVSNNLDFSSSTGANLPNAFLGTWASNGAKMEYSGTLTPASDAYRLGGKSSSGLLAMVGTNKLTGARGLIVGGTGASGIRVMLAGENNFTGDTVINTGAKLTLANNLALQNSALDVGAAGGNFALNSAGTVTNAAVASSPTFGGLKGSRDLLTVFTNAGGNNESNLAAASVTGFTLNVGTGVTCQYSGAIANFATGTALTKSGPGTQILSGSNTYTGATHITGGTLGLDTTGSITNSASVSIAAGATWDTSGKSSHSIPASQPVTFGIDASGSGSCGKITAAGLTITNAVVHYNITGTPDDPVYVLATYTSLTGSAFASVDAPPAGYILDYAYQGNKIALVQDIGPGPVDHFVISAIASPQTVGTPITGITITAQDASNETATSFTGTVTFGGTAGITGTSANFVDGVLSGVSVTPTTAGSNLTFTVDDGSGHTGSTTFTVQTVFQNWAGAQGLAGDDALPGANPDNDLLNNLLEFAFGTDPNTPSSGPVAYSEGVVTAHGQPLLVELSGNRHAVFARRVDHASVGLNYAVRFSADLETGYWETSSAVPTVLATDGVIEAVAVPYPGTVPASSGPKTARFFQVMVTGN